MINININAKRIIFKNNEHSYSDNSSIKDIEIIRRTLDNNTHEVLEDTMIKRVTSWRKSEDKFKKYLILNIFSFGILHLISLFHPNLYIKLYCIPSPAKECDFFLVENIYGKLTLCKLIFRKKRNSNKEDFEIIKGNISQMNNNNIKSEYNNIIKKAIYSFEYNSHMYEYDENNNEISPIYFNLSKIMNKDIYNYFSDGLSSKGLVDILREKYGKNQYKLNLNIIHRFFFKNQIPSLVIIIGIGIIEFINLKNYVMMQIKVLLAIIIIIIELFVTKILVINKYKKEFTLDGKSNKVRVKRKYLLKNENQLYYNLDIIDLLPGDIILLKSEDEVPCDCLIIEGECMVNESNLTGSLNIYKKRPIKTNSEYFDYKYSNINILYHGMKILKTYSKLNNGFVTALCINTGPNTFKANQYSNTLYFFNRKKQYSYVYNLFGERKKIFLYMIINLFIIIIFSIIYSNSKADKKEFKSEFFKQNMTKVIIAIICKDLMAVFFIIQNVINFFAIINLGKLDLLCFDKSRLIKSGKVNTIIINKTETLCENSLEIHGYHPVLYNTVSPYNLIFKNFLKSQCKDLNKILFDYYQNYLTQPQNLIKQDIKNSKKKYKYSINSINNNLFIDDIRKNLPTVIFIECMLCCNSIDKYDMDYFGNDIEIEMFNDMKWDIKEIEENNNNNYVKIKFNKDVNNYPDSKIISNIKFNSQYYYITRKIADIFPKNYYKLAEINNKNNFNTIFKKSGLNINLNNISRTTTNRTVSSSIYFSNQIQVDIENNLNITNTYKLRIYKKFNLNGNLGSAAIVYNFLSNELRFMIKGNPEEIINKCKNYTLPYNFEIIISDNRKNGYIILACATKKLELDEYEENDELEYYMEDLTFLGFITLKNRVKEYVPDSIEEIKNINDNFIITSGDNEYNCLSSGFQSGIIEDKNIFVFDKEDNNKISIKKICSSLSKKERERIDEKYNIDKEKITKYSRNITYSRVTTKNSQITVDSYYDKNLINKIVTKEDRTNTNDLNLIELNNLEGIDEIAAQKVKKIKDQGGRRRLNQDNKELIIGNSEYERFNSSISRNTDDKTNNRKRRNKDGEKYTNDIRQKDETNYKYLNFMEKYYYHDKLKEYGDMKNSIFCISGKFFKYLANNKSNKGAKNFMKVILEKAKIFFNMTSLDKSLLVDYYRESPDNVVCVIGQCDSDIDSIFSSDIGINLKNPKNMNTILCHYYSQKNDIICIKNIIMNGKVFFENNVILEAISFVCSLTLEGYLLCSLIRNVDINEGELNFLEIEFFILATLSFLSKTKEDNYINQNSKLLNFYYYLQLGENVVFKLLGFIIFCLLYKGNSQIDSHLLDSEFNSYLFVLIIEFLIGGILSFNFVSFYRESVLTNYYLIITIDIFLIYLILLVFLNSSNYSMDILSITKFNRDENIMDCFSDRNRIVLLIAILFDFFGTLFVNWLTFIIFRKYLN